MALLALACASHGLVASTVAATLDTPEIERRDYIVFADAGRRVLEGDLEGLYDPRPGGFPFLHPPFVAALSAPLAWLAPRAAYLAIVSISLAASVLAAALLRRLRAGEHDLVALFVLASAPHAIALLLGQPIALLLAAFVCGLVLAARGRHAAAGASFALLLLKPPLALAPLAMLLVARRPRALVAFAAVALALVLLSLPLGVERWTEWVIALVRAMRTLDPESAWKQHTLLAFLESALPIRATALWLGMAIPLGLATLRLASIERLGALRAGGLLALATVALSPYAYYYDALFLAVPAAALWLEREAYRPASHRVACALAACTFAAQHLGFFALQRGPAISGLMVTGWLVAELFASRQRG